MKLKVDFIWSRPKIKKRIHTTTAMHTVDELN